jgi:DNA-3-methyladenine glycosylase
VGTLLVRQAAADPVAGLIVEVEAYLGRADRASHARAGLTTRTRPMFGPPGHAYVYRLYGMHWAFNVVAHEPDQEAGAVLVRAALPLVGVEVQRERRGRADDPVAKLASGPGRLCQAFAITGADDRCDLTTGRGLWIGAADPELVTAAVQADRGGRPAGEPVPADRRVLVGPRVNVEGAGHPWASMPFRFGLAGSAALSRPFR